MEGEVFVEAQRAKLSDALGSFFCRSSFGNSSNVLRSSAGLVSKALPLGCISSRDACGILATLPFGFGSYCSSGSGGSSALGL
jgi:hypothetical protein